MKKKFLETNALELSARLGSEFFDVFDLWALILVNKYLHKILKQKFSKVKLLWKKELKKTEILTKRRIIFEPNVIQNLSNFIHLLPQEKKKLKEAVLFFPQICHICQI